MQLLQRVSLSLTRTPIQRNVDVHLVNVHLPAVTFVNLSFNHVDLRLWNALSS